MKELLSYDLAQETQKWLELPWYSKVGAYNTPQTIQSANEAAAIAMWTERVGQNRPWDHKLILRKLFDGVWHKQGSYEYFYDIWSNIHYGYIGSAAGFSDVVLLDGAGIEQIFSDSIRLVSDPLKHPGPRRSSGVDGPRAWDDDPDRISIGIGMALYNAYPEGNLSGIEVMSRVLAVPITDWKCGVQFHACYGEKNEQCR